LALVAGTLPLKAQEVVPLPTVTVSASTPTTLSQLNIDALLQEDATAEQGYRPKILSNVGALGARSIKDTPYSISVISRELLENIQASSTDDVFRIDPFTQNNFPIGRANPFSVGIRGFASSTTAIDNMRLWNTAVIDVEGLERVEVTRGLSGFLYGATDPGGMVNFVLKRPTQKAFANIRVGDYGIGPLTGGAGYVHADFGGPIDKEGQFGYRLNIVGQGGDTSVENQRLQRNYVSGALDWHITQDAIAQFNFFHSYRRLTSPDPFWFFSDTVFQGQAPSAQQSWSQNWGYNSTEQNGGEAKITWKVNDIFTARAGFIYIRTNSSGIAINNSVSNNSGTYSQSAVANATGDLTTMSGYGLVDADFETGPVKHKVTAGYFTQRYESRLPEDAAAFPSVPGTFTFATPYYTTQPSFTIGTRQSSLYFWRANENAVLGDQIDYGPISIIAGITHAQIKSLNNTYLPAAGQSRVWSSSYDTGQFTPSGSVLFRVTPELSAYATYIEGLESVSAASSSAVNAGQAFSPSLDHQFEVGAKADVEGTLLTLAFFDIDKAYAFLDNDNVYKVQGREEHKGVEIGASGKVTPDLTIFAGATFLDPRITNDPTLTGKQPINVSSRMAKLYSEYKLPFLPGVTLTGGVSYYGSYAANTLNTQFLPGYVTGDLGLRYEMNINNVPVTARFNMTNIANHSYWMSNRFVGAPRQISFTLATRF